MENAHACVDEEPLSLPRQSVRAMPSLLLVGSFPPPRGGVTVHLERLAKRLQGEGIPYERLNESFAVRNDLPNIRSISLRAYWQMVRGNWLVHVHSSNVYVRLIHTVSAKLANRKVVQTLHSGRQKGLALKALQLACFLSDDCIAVSDAIREGVWHKAHVVPAYLPPTCTDEIIEEDTMLWIEHQRRSGRKVIAFNAFNTAKIESIDLYGTDMLVALLGRHEFKDGYSAVACIATDRPNPLYLDEIRRRVTQERLDDRLKLIVGEVSFAGILRNCDVFLRLTTTDGDAVSVRESLWYGIPTIASDAAVRPEGTHIYRSRDLEDLVTSLLRVEAESRQPCKQPDFGAKVLHVYRGLLQPSV